MPTLIDSKFVGVPVGGIIMWNGTDVPENWALCNGQIISGIQTPDLRDRFIVGSGGIYGIGSTGGTNEVILTTDQLPPHKHHTFKNEEGSWSGEESAKMGWGPGHNSQYYIQASASEADKLFTSNSGLGMGHENRPPYYALAFIMRVQ